MSFRTGEEKMIAFDHVGRLRKIQNRIVANGGSAAVITKAPNIRYLTGFWGYVTRAEYSEPRRLIALIVPSTARPLLIVPKIEHEFALAATAGLEIDVRRHVEWMEDGETEDSWGLARSFLREAGTKAGKIFYERQHMTVRAAAAFDEAFQDFTLADGSGWVDELRIIKDDVEIDLLRRCGKLTVEMFEVQVGALKKGPLREFELAMLGWEHVVACCAKEMGPHQVNSPVGEGVQLITSGPRLARAHGSASTRQIEPDDVVMMDFCRVPYLWGYRMGMGRVVSLRKLNSEEIDIHAAITRSYKVGIEMLRPGTRCSDIDSAIRGIMVDAGLAPHIVHRAGRGVGIENVELPEIKQGIPDVIQAGMVVSIEPSIYRAGFASRIEDTFLVTEKGPELLTTAPNDIRVLRL
jgi:Xaa-Pro aminopeptidase